MEWEKMNVVANP